jgi:hypothetical protein
MKCADAASPRRAVPRRAHHVSTITQISGLQAAVEQLTRCLAVICHPAKSGLQQADQLQVGDVFEDGRRRDVRDVIVRADFGFLYRGPESVGRR